MTTVSFLRATIPVPLLLFTQISASQTCEADQAAFQRISEKLTNTRAAIKKDEADLAYMRKAIDDANDHRSNLIATMEVLSKEKDSYKYKILDMELRTYVDKIAQFKKRESEIKNDLAYQKKEEPFLLNSFHLVRDRLDKNCGGVKPGKKDVVNVSGDWRSPYGRTVMTQGSGNPAPLTGVVHYDTGGTSTLTGTFDGTSWKFTWRNTFNYFGNGAMTYANGEFTGWWINKAVQPYEKGNWWLRK